MAMKRNITTIRLVKVPVMGRNKELYFDKILMLRKARNIGDIENINNFQLGILNRNKGSEFDFEIIK